MASGAPSLAENVALPAKEAPAATPVASKLPEMVTSDQMKALLGDILHANLSTMHLVIAPPNSRGKGEALKAFTDFLNKSQHELLVGRQTNPDCVGNWVKDLRQVGVEELARRAEINEKGRGAEDASSLKKYVTVWGDLMRDWEEAHGAKAIAAAKKAAAASRYALPDHVRALGIELQKSDTSFVPRHSAREEKSAGQEERDSAIGRLKESKKRGVQDGDDDVAEGGSKSIDNRGSKPHLRPTPLKVANNAGRDKFFSALTGYLQTEASNGLAERMEKKSQELARYTEALTAHPELSETFIPLIKGASAMLAKMQEEEMRKANADEFTTPPSTQNAAAPGSGESGASNVTSTTSTSGEGGAA
jgi:hypothetical protein